MPRARCRKHFAPSGMAVAAVVAALAANSANAQRDGYNSSTGVQGVCRTNCNTSSSSGQSANSGTNTSDGSGGIFGYLLREVFRDRSGEHQARATQINNQGVALARSGNRAAAMEHYRRAFAINSQSPMIRLNMMMTLNWLAYNELQVARSAGDRNAIARIEAMLAESDRLANSQVAALEGYAEIVSVRARLRSDVGQLRQDLVRAAQNERELNAASRQIAGITQNLTASLASDARTSRAGQTQNGLGFGDPAAQQPAGAVVQGASGGRNANGDPGITQLNDGALSQQAAVVERGPRRQGFQATPPTALGQAERAGLGGQDTNRTFDGGESHSNADAVDPGGAPPTPPGAAVLNDTQIARYSAASPEFRDAHAAVERARTQREAARQRLASLEQQAARTSDQQQRQRIQIAISAASAAASQAESAQRATEVRRDDVIRVIEGPPIIRGAPPAAPPPLPPPPSPPR